MPALRITRAGLLGSLIVLLVAATCVRLGFWQLHRLGERRLRNAEIGARMSAPPVNLDRASGDTTGLTFRRASATGPFDNDRSVVWAGRSFQGDPGVYLLTPLMLPGGGALLVNRGWLPSPDAATVDLRPYAVAGTVRATGILMPLPPPPATPDTITRRVRYHLDREAVARSLPYTIGPLVLQVEAAGSGRELPRPLPAPALDEGPHLSYAIQWFSFAAIGIGGWLAMLLRGGRGADDDESAPTPRPE